MSNQPPQNNVIELAPQRMGFQEIAHAGGKIEFVREGDEITGIKVSINRSAFQLLATPNRFEISYSP